MGEGWWVAADQGSMASIELQMGIQAHRRRHWPDKLLCAGYLTETGKPLRVLAMT